MKFIVSLIVLALFFQGLASVHAQKISPTEVPPTPVQKTPVQQRAIPDQVIPDQVSPMQKGVPNIPVDVPEELLDALGRLQRQPCEPLRNIGRCIVRKAIKKRIANYIQDNLPSLPPLPLP